MKTRIIQTRFWDDELNEQVDIYAQHLYIYLLSSKHINICGYFQLRDAVIKLEAKLTDNQLKEAKYQLSAIKKVFFKDGWIRVVNARKNNAYENSPKNKIACEEEISKVPSSILKFFDTSMDSSIDTTMHSSPKPQSQSQSISKSKSLKELDIKDIDKLQQDFPTKDVKGELEKAKDWLSSTGKVKKDYLAFFRNWLRRSPDFQSEPVKREVIKINSENLELLKQGKEAMWDLQKK